MALARRGARLQDVPAAGEATGSARAGEDEEVVDGSVFGRRAARARPRDRLGLSHKHLLFLSVGQISRALCAAGVTRVGHNPQTAAGPGLVPPSRGPPAATSYEARRTTLAVVLQEICAAADVGDCGARPRRLLVNVASAAFPPSQSFSLRPFQLGTLRASSFSPPIGLDSRLSSTRRPAPEAEERCSGTGCTLEDGSDAG